jgi:hypothetical protein
MEDWQQCSKMAAPVRGINELAVIVKGVIRCFNVFWFLSMVQHGRSGYFLSRRGWHRLPVEAFCCFAF